MDNKKDVVVAQFEAIVAEFKDQFEHIFPEHRPATAAWTDPATFQHCQRYLLPQKKHIVNKNEKNVSSAYMPNVSFATIWADERITIATKDAIWKYLLCIVEVFEAHDVPEVEVSAEEAEMERRVQAMSNTSIGKLAMDAIQAFHGDEQQPMAPGDFFKAGGGCQEMMGTMMSNMSSIPPQQLMSECAGIMESFGGIEGIVKEMGGGEVLKQALGSAGGGLGDMTSMLGMLGVGGESKVSQKTTLDEKIKLRALELKVKELEQSSRDEIMTDAELTEFCAQFDSSRKGK